MTNGPDGSARAGSATASPSFREALGAWFRIGLLSFGGPAAQIAVMHKIIVDERKWLGETQFLNALSFCMLLPGPEAMQLATYAGWRLHGVRGGLAAGLLFVLPGALVVLALSMIYAAFGKLPVVEALFLGIKSAVLVIVIEALLRIAKRALKRPEHWAIAVLSFLTIFFLALPFPLIIAAAAAFGFLKAGGEKREELPAFAALASVLQTARTIAVWLALWFAPLWLLSALSRNGQLVTPLAWFFSKLAVVTFGGAYAVLAYMGQDVVIHYHWLQAGQMMDGLGLAETTPGPLILVTEFVGFMAAWQYNGGHAWAMGLVGAFIALWATFVPCFLWIFAGAPYLEWITRQPRLRGALTAITAAVVGVILNLAVWFSLHVFFRNVALVKAGPLILWTPELASIDWRVVGLAALSGFLLLRQHWSIHWVLGLAAGLALGMSYLPV
jgi:chromate transporter